TVTVPSSVRELLQVRLGDLVPAERALLDVGSVIGFTFDPDLVARALGATTLEVLQTLAAMERRSGVVRATGAGFQFDHHLRQEVVDGNLDPETRARHHALLADAYAERHELTGCAAEAMSGEAVVFLAEHSLRGGRRARGRELAPAALEH